MRFKALTIALTIAGAALPAAPAAAQDPEPDGRVEGLNPAVFAVVQAVRTRNPGAINANDARQISAAIMADGAVDPVERDLLGEFTQATIRSIRVTKQGAPQEALLVFTAGTDPKRIFEDTLHPPVDYGPVWAKPDHGWAELLAEARRDARRRTGVVDFITAQLTPKWKESSPANAYKPLADEMVDLYRIATAQRQADDVDLGRTLVHDAARQLDLAELDRMPDFLYDWVRPKPAGS